MIRLDKPKIGCKRNLAGILTLCMFMPMMPHGCGHTGAHQRHKEKSSLVGNRVCPVSGQKIDEATKVTYIYKGKSYNLCCANCVDDFKKDLEKYIKKIEEEKLQGKSKQEELPSGESHQYRH